jgi:hypothetical protein
VVIEMWQILEKVNLFKDRPYIICGICEAHSLKSILAKKYTLSMAKHIEIINKLK